MSNVNLETYALPVQGPQWPRAIRSIASAREDESCPALRLVPLPGTQAIEVRQPEALLGRHSDCDLQLMQPDVSRRHCKLIFADNQWHIEDLGSLNGTIVNGKEIDRTALQPNDMIRIGGFLFQVEMEAAALPLPLPDAEEGDLLRTHSILRGIAARLPEDQVGESERRERRSA